MSDVMMTGRVSEEKKNLATIVLQNAGMNASQAINLMVDRLIAEQDVSFLFPEKKKITPEDFSAAAAFVDALVVKKELRFDTMTIGEIKAERYRSKNM